MSTIICKENKDGSLKFEMDVDHMDMLAMYDNDKVGHIMARGAESPHEWCLILAEIFRGMEDKDV